MMFSKDKSILRDTSSEMTHSKPLFTHFLSNGNKTVAYMTALKTMLCTETSVIEVVAAANVSAFSDHMMALESKGASSIAVLPWTPCSVKCTLCVQ